MVDAPNYSDIEGSTVRLNDVNGDGLADLVQIRYDAVDIWLNVDGRGWTERHILDGTLRHAGFHNRVRLIDVDGSGTLDVLYGDAKGLQAHRSPGRQEAVSPDIGGQRPRQDDEHRILHRCPRRCWSRLGAAMRAVRLQPDRFAAAWCSTAPIVSHVSQARDGARQRHDSWSSAC